jgi:hypothetical protein
MYDETTGELMPSRVKALTSIIADYEAEQERVCAKFPTCVTDDVTGLADLAEAVCRTQRGPSSRPDGGGLAGRDSGVRGRR